MRSFLTNNTFEATKVRPSIKYTKWIAYFAIVDLLFLPYFQLIVIPYSLPIIITSMVWNKVKLKNDFYAKSFLIICLCIIFSFLISLNLTGSQPYVIENLKRVFQLLTSFCYFFYFRWIVSKVAFDISNVVNIFILWYVFLSTAFIFNPIAVHELLTNIYGRLVTDQGTFLEHMRFPYLFNDPNAAIYFFLMAIYPVFRNAKVNFTTILGAILCSIPVLVSQSRGGMIAYGLMLIVTVAIKVKSFKSISTTKILVWTVASLLVIFMMSAAIIDFADNNPLFDLAYQRMFELEDTGYGYGTAGGRTEIWYSIIQTFDVWPLGRSYTFGGFGPHSDFLRIIYSYGLLSMPFFIFFFFSQLFKFPQLVLVGLISFSINSLMDEQKILALYLSIIAINVGRIRVLHKFDIYFETRHLGRASS